MVQNWITSILMFSLIPVIFFIFAMLAQKIFIGLIKIKNNFLRWLTILIAILIISIAFNILILLCFALYY